MPAPCYSINRASRNRPRRSHREHATSSIVILPAIPPSVTASPFTVATIGSQQAPADSAG